MTRYTVKLASGELLNGVLFEYVDYTTCYPRLSLAPLGVVDMICNRDKIVINTSIANDNELQDRQNDHVLKCSEIVSVSKDSIPLYTPLMYKYK